MNDGESARVAVITGATGGVGAAVAKVLSRAGYSLVLTAPSMEKLSALAAQLKGPCTVIEGSLGNEDLPETLLYAALDRFGRCDICFNNGALYEAGIIETVDIERLTSMIRVNVEGSFRVAYVFLKHFVSEGSGHLVNVSSTVGSSSRPTPYAATQRAVEVLSDALAAELGDGDVLVSCIQPGLVKTGLHHRWEIAPEGSAGFLPEPDDFARMVLFILEETSPRHRNRLSETTEETQSASQQSESYAQPVGLEDTSAGAIEAAEQTASLSSHLESPNSGDRSIVSEQAPQDSEQRASGRLSITEAFDEPARESVAKPAATGGWEFAGDEDSSDGG
ncbi:MAG: SDR family NAD(P)-dependent oxidoreductase [Acidobacteria bacterium]|nr:SDR family NAD(P)-dependent oxidoreductase [Acidobacteriota bacterium]